MDIIILNQPHRLSPSRPPLHCETFPQPSGSTNTAGEALAYLSLSTGDTTLRTRYDCSQVIRRTGLSLRSIGFLATREEPSLGLGGRTKIRGSFRRRPPRTVCFTGCAAAPSCRCAHSSRCFHRNYFIYSQTESNHSQAKSIIIDRVFSCEPAALLAVERDKH